MSERCPRRKWGHPKFSRVGSAKASICLLHEVRGIELVERDIVARERVRAGRNHDIRSRSNGVMLDEFGKARHKVEGGEADLVVPFSRSLLSTHALPFALQPMWLR